MPTSTPQNKLIERLLKKRVRICKSLHECCLCAQPIKHGEAYFDGGYGCRAHAKCADPKGWGSEPKANNLYDVAKEVCHENGLPWTDPRSGVTHQPPGK